MTTTASPLAAIDPSVLRRLVAHHAADAGGLDVNDPDNVFPDVVACKLIQCKKDLEDASTPLVLDIGVELGIELAIATACSPFTVDREAIRYAVRRAEAAIRGSAEDERRFGKTKGAKTPAA